MMEVSEENLIKKMSKEKNYMLSVAFKVKEYLG